MNYGDQCTRAYLPTGQQAHLLPPGDSPNSKASAALCDTQPGLFGMWLGTGTQAEYEKAASLPPCPNCAAELAAREGARL